MRQRVLTATQFLEEHDLVTPETGTLSGHLLRPFLDLGGPGGPVNAKAAAYVGESVAEPEPAADGWIAPQGNTKRSLRTALIRETGLASYDVTWPGELPETARSPHWQALCDAVDAWDELGAFRRYQVICALYKLCLFDAAVALGDRLGPPGEFTALSELRVIGARSKLGESVHDLVPRTLAVSAHTPASPRVRLAVAVNLAIHYGRATRDREATVEWSDRVLAEAAAQHAEGSPRDLLMASITLRAASFGPFVRGDHDAVAAMLKQAEAHAVDVTGAPGVPLVLADENRYAVLETITNAAVARGDRETALAAATALTGHDPREPRAWLQLGAVHWDDGRTQDALDAYRTAAVLGAPFTGTAWYCTGRCHEALGELDQAAQAYANSVAAEPLGITALHRLHGVADRTGQRFLAGWARDRLHVLHHRLAGPAAPVPSSTTVRQGARA